MTPLVVIERKRPGGDFLGVFLRVEGSTVEPYGAGSPDTHQRGGPARAHTQRPKTIVALAVAGGNVTLSPCRRVLAIGRCNMLITAEPTAMLS